VAGPTSGDSSADPTEGAAERQQYSAASESLAVEDCQTLGDRDQTLADADQTRSDRDQTAADSDQAAADSDQAASDRELVRGGDADLHDITRDLRDRSTERRRESALGRVDEAAARDAVAQARDQTALARDRAALLRDREMASDDAAGAGDRRSATVSEIVLRAAEARAGAAADRDAAADGRVRAAADRAQAAQDRDQAADERLQAQTDRDALITQLAIAETDELTGSRTRAAGLLDLDHDIDRARRTTGQLVVAYVDVVGLKAVNDVHGHAAGDAILKRAVDVIRRRLRSYDLIVRLGGDEFLCSMSGTIIEEARRRFGEVATDLAHGSDRCEIKIGYAELAPGDSTAQLIARADAALPTSPPRTQP
jgi:diguanylate cyclase (GGDEF)-like protein